MNCESVSGSNRQKRRQSRRTPKVLATFSNGPTRGAYTEIVRNGLGARGIDYVEVFKTGSATSVRFPVYDGHGNMTACLLRDGAGGFTLTSRRSYDPWGAMRQWGTHPSGASAYQGAPSNRYVGSLGHQQDDDSGLYYMRARYYEPGSGRFISEDTKYDGTNWFAYAQNNPTNMVDRDGHLTQVAAGFLIGFFFGFMTEMFNQMFEKGTRNISYGQCLVTGLIAGIAGAALASGVAFLASLPGGAGLAGVFSAMGTGASGVSLSHILGGAVMGGLLTAVVTQFCKGVAKAVGSAFARNSEIMMLLAMEE